MKIPVMNPVKAFTAGAVGLAVAAMGIYMAAGDVPGAPLFPEPQQVPSVVDSTPAAQYAAAVERARVIVRAAVLEQNLPGVSVAVGTGLPSAALAKKGLPSVALAKKGLPSVALAKEGSVVWAEGFGWRDVVTRAPMTPATRFNIGTAAAAFSTAVAPLGLANTGADSAADWSPEHIGEPEEDFPPLTFLRHVVWQPLGLMPAEYPLPGDRATFYVPRSDDNPGSGRRLMYMRDLACCANGKAFYSTPTDLVRFALAKNPGNVDGELAGGMVMSLTTGGDTGLVVAVTSNIAHAKTSSLAQQVGDAFAGQTR